jgi:hypothetical protein
MENLYFKVHAANLLREAVEGSKAGHAIAIPMQLLIALLAQVGQRAAELNDPKLNALMCRMAIYSISDPHSSDFDKKLTNQIIEAGK